MTTTIGWLICCGVVLAAIWFMRLPSVENLHPQEIALLQSIADTRPMEPASANWLDIPGHPLYLLFIIVVVLLTAIRLGRLIEGVSLVAGFLLISLTVGLGWTLWARDRPDLVLNGAFSPGLHSFPSGHTAQATTIYGLLAYLWVRRARRRSEQMVALLLLLGAIITVAIGRLWIAAHWPSDVLVSLLIGGIMVLGLALAIGRAESQMALATNSDFANAVIPSVVGAPSASVPKPTRTIIQ